MLELQEKRPKLLWGQSGLNWLGPVSREGLQVLDRERYAGYGFPEHRQTLSDVQIPFHPSLPPRQWESRKADGPSFDLGERHNIYIHCICQLSVKLRIPDTSPNSTAY